MYKFIERMAWITGSLSVVGVMLIMFLHGTKKEPTLERPSNAKRPFVRLSASPTTNKKTEETPSIKTETPKPAPVIEKPVIEPAKPKEERREEEKPISKPREREPKPENRPQPEPRTTSSNSSNVLFAESELNQLVGKIQAEKIRQNSSSNCIQIRITADNNNTQAVAQVERFLATKNYIITGREKEDFLRGSGLKVSKRGNCLNVTVGRK